MFTRVSYRTVVIVSGIVSVLSLGLVAVVSGQGGTSPTPSRSPLEDLLAEVRGLRAEIRHAADASFRAQLLVARLQLQEQRINTLARQLADVQRQQSDNEQARAAMAAPMAAFAGEQGTQSLAERKEFEQIFKPLKIQLEQLEKTDRELKVQQTYLTGQIAEEQARWTTFNALLDELGKAVDARTSR